MMTMFPRLQQALEQSASSSQKSDLPNSSQKFTPRSSSHKCTLPNFKYCLMDLAMESSSSLTKLSSSKRYDWVPMSVCTMYTTCSSTAHNGVFSGAELLNYGGDNQRKSSSETRTSSSPDDNANTKDRRRDHRPNSRGKRRTSQNNGLVPVERIPREFDPDLPSVLDENISGTRLGIPAHQNKTRTGTRPPALKPLNSAPDQLPSYQVNNPEHRHINPLSISGLAKPNTNTSIDDTSRKAGWTHTQNARVPTVIKPPVISSQLQQNRNNSNSSPAVAASVNTTVTTLQRNTDNSSNGGLSTLAVNASGTGSSTIPRRSYKQNGLSGSGGVSKQVINSQKKTSEEPKYADPISGASSSFQARLSELASLEAETVRFERMRKLKKKNKERDD